jgi:hypothetical protein
MAFNRDLDDHGRAFTCPAEDFCIAAQGGGSISNASQTEMLAIACACHGCFWRKPLPIVLHRQGDLPSANLKASRGLGGDRMPGYIGQRFLSDAVQSPPVTRWQQLEITAYRDIQK